MVNSVSAIRLLEAPKASRERSSGTVIPATRSESARPSAVVGFGSSLRHHSSAFLAQLLAAANRHSGVELDETPASLARYARAAGTASSGKRGVDLTI